MSINQINQYSGYQPNQQVSYNPPQQPGLDDETGEPLVQREDDKEATVRNRLDVYHQQTEPLVEFYQNLRGDDVPQYIKVEGVGGLEEIRDRVFSALA